jgi:hypothetical protein
MPAERSQNSFPRSRGGGCPQGSPLRRRSTLAGCRSRAPGRRHVRQRDAPLRCNGSCTPGRPRHSPKPACASPPAPRTSTRRTSRRVRALPARPSPLSRASPGKCVACTGRDSRAWGYSVRPTGLSLWATAGILRSSSGYEGKKKAGASLDASASCSGGYSARARGALGTLRIPLRVLREGPLLGSHADQS